MNKGTHLLIKFIPSDKEVLPIQFMFNPSQFYMTFVQLIYTCKGEWYCRLCCLWTQPTFIISSTLPELGQSRSWQPLSGNFTFIVWTESTDFEIKSPEPIRKLTILDSKIRVRCFSRCPRRVTYSALRGSRRVQSFRLWLWQNYINTDKSRNNINEGVVCIGQMKWCWQPDCGRKWSKDRVPIWWPPLLWPRAPRLDTKIGPHKELSYRWIAGETVHASMKEVFMPAWRNSHPLTCCKFYKEVPFSSANLPK